MVIATLVTSLFLVVNVHASTPVSGTINQDTTWTQTNSPYILTGTVLVNNGVILTIQPGVTVDLSAYSIQVSGTLNAVGTSDSQIVFTTGSFYTNTRVIINAGSTPWNESTGTGCIIKYAVFNAATAYISNSSPKICNCYFANSYYTSLGGLGGSPTIVNNAFSAGGSAAISYSGGSPTISYNFIKTSGSGYGVSTTSSTAYISDNNITNCYTAISASGNSTITRNLLTSNTYGANCNSINVTTESNTISNNTYGIYGGGTIRGNTIGNNNIGLTLNIASSNVTQNNIFNNTQNNLRTSSQINVDATNNWWGTTDASTINQTIYDSKNAAGLGNVTFVPFLTAPNPNAPALESTTYLPNPTPTVIPSPIPATTPTYAPWPTNNTWVPTATPQPTPTPSPTPIPTPTQPPTPSPTPKIMPGSPLSLGGTSFAEAISQFDITALAELVLMALGIVWLIVILFYVDRDFIRKENKKPKDK